MAGETPGANRAGKQRTRLKFGDDKSTSKYYGSNQPSAITNSPADSRGRLGTPPKPNPTPNPKLDERSADKKYYASPTAPVGKKPVRRVVGAPVPLAENVVTAVADLTITRDTEVNPVMDEVVRRLTGGESKVVVTVADGSPLRRARAKLDSLVTRQLLTEDQGRDVQFSLLPVKERLPKAEREANFAADKAIEELLGAPPVPTATKSLDAEEPIDIDSILSGALEEETVDTSPQAIETVDLSQDADEGDDVDEGDEDEKPVSTSQDVNEEATPDGSIPETVTRPVEEAKPDAEPAADADGDEQGDEQGDDGDE